MQLARLGRTERQVSRVAFGAGPIPELLTEHDQQRQVEVVRRALDAGINWFDTAASYGDGRSEAHLGRALQEIGPATECFVATKVRLLPDQLNDIVGVVERSPVESLERLQMARLPLLQLHNSITAQRGDLPTSLTPADVLGPRGVLAGMQQLLDQKLVDGFGLTGIGDPACLCEVVDSGEFATMQVPYNLLNPTAGRELGPTFSETDYGNIISACRAQDMGVFAIRVLAGGAVLNRPPAKHTYRTKFFPLDLYQRDVALADRIRTCLPGDLGIYETAIRFSLSHPGVDSAIVGLSDVSHIDQALESAAKGPLPTELIDKIVAQLLTKDS